MLLLTFLQAQGTAPPTPLTLLAREGRRPIPTTVVNGQELVALDDVATLFQVTVREDALAGGITVTYRGRSIAAAADQAMASVNGRVVTLPSPIVRAGRRWLVPLEFLSRALAPIYDQRIDVRRTARLVILGDLRVPRVTGRLDAAGPPTRATIEITPAAPVTVGNETGRVVLRIDADALDLALPATAGGLIEQIRAGEQPNSVIVVLAAGAGIARAVPAAADNMTRIAVEVAAAGAVAEAPAAPRPTASPVLPAPPSEPLTLITSRAFQTIVIDPGHGGEDIGTRGAGGAEEKQLTLDVARRLRGLLETRLGLRVILTRDDDRRAGPDERAATANNSKADLFLSLHANAALTPSVAGAEIYHLRLDPEGEEARRAATADAVTLPVLGGNTRTLDIVRWDLAQVPHVDESARLGIILEEELRRRVPMSPRAIQQAPMRVLRGANMPAALVEMAYLTNPDQEKLAAGEEFKNSVAQALYEGIVRFRAFVEEQGTR